MAAIRGTNKKQTLTGTAAKDKIFGLGGTDTLDGGRGRDTMRGGKGNDTYIVDNIADKAIELANQGTGTVSAKQNYL